jgi:hypothetical protein
MYDVTNPLQNDKDKIVCARSDEANIIFRWLDSLVRWDLQSEKNMLP